MNEWMEEALCRAEGSNPEDWFSDSVNSARTFAAINTCKVCPVQANCLAYAKRTHPTAGIWGGISADRIHHLRKRNT
jgi:WhiB family redox-sensing transcriptional regulator